MQDYPRTPFFRRRRLLQLLALAIFAGSALYFSLHWARVRQGVAMRDLVAPYAGARCLWAGCNAYGPAQIAGEFARAGGGREDHPKWSEAPPVYPPSALVALLPLSLLPWQAARAVWHGMGVLLLCAGLLAVADLTPVERRPWCLLLGALLLGSEAVALLWNVGQPSAVAIGVSALALWCLVRERFVTVGWIALGLATALKPQMAGLVILCLAARPAHRRSAIKAALLALALLAVGCAWLSLAPASRTWPHDLQAAINGTLVPGGVNDPSLANYGSIQFTDAQAVLALWIKSSRGYNLLAYALGSALLAAWFVMVKRAGPSRRALFYSLAAMACLGLLPVYHREYDLALLMLSFPALLDLLFVRGGLRQRVMGFAALAATAILLAPPRLHHPWLHAVLDERLLPCLTSPEMRSLLLLRQMPVLLLVLSLLYLGALGAVRDKALSSGSSATPSTL